MLQVAYVLGFLGREITYTFLQILHPAVIVAICGPGMCHIT